MPTPPLVWLPFDSAVLGDVPDGLRYEVVDPTRHVPGSVAEVAYYVTPYRLGSEAADVLPAMSRLQVVQTLTAGVDAVIPQVSSLVGVHLGADAAHTYDEAKQTDEALFGRFFHEMLARGVALAPGAYEVLFPGLAHTDEVIDAIGAAAVEAVEAAVR